MIVAYIDHAPVLLSYLLVNASAEANKRPAKLYIKDNFSEGLSYRGSGINYIPLRC